MADSVVKLRIDSKEYDANIKCAGQALADYFNKVKEGGGTLMHLDEGVLDAVKAMGQLGTQSKSTKGALRELTQGTIDMTAAYRSLTDEERNSPLGQEMAKSIAQMTERAGQARDAMADVNAAISNAASDTRGFDQLAQGVSTVTATFQTAQGAAKLLGVGLGDNVEVLAKLQAAMAVTNGLTQIQTAVQKQSALMQGVAAVQAKALAAAQALQAKNTAAATVAQRAFNAVAKANPYLLLATAAAAAVSALALFSSGTENAATAQENLNDKLSEGERRLKSISDEYERQSNLRNRLGGQSEGEALAGRAEAIKKQIEEIRRRGTEIVQDVVNGEKTRFGGVIAEIGKGQGRSDNEIAQLLMESDEKKYRDQIDELTALAERRKELDQELGEVNTKLQANRQSQEYLYVNWRNLVDPREIEAAKSYFTELLTKELPTTPDFDKKASEYQNIISQLDQRLRKVKTQSADIKVEDIYPEGSMKALQKELQDLQARQQLATNTKGWRELAGQIENVQARMVLLKGEIPDGKAVELTITADNAEALQAVQQLAGVTVEPKTLTITADNAEALQAVQQLAGVTVEPKTLTITAENAEALQAVQQLAGVTVEPKTLTITADNAEALQAVQDVAGVTIDPKTVKIKILPKVGLLETGTSIQNSAGIKEYIGSIQQQLDRADFGTPLYHSLSAQLADMTTLQNLVGESLKVGLGTVMFDVADELGADFWTRAMEGGVENADWQAVMDVINAKRKELGLDALTLNFDTGNVSTDSKSDKDAMSQVQKVSGGLQSVSSGLQQLGVKLPDGVQKFMSGVQGLISVINGVQNVVSAFSTTTATAQTTSVTSNTAMLAAINAQLPVLIGSINANTVTPSLLAHGGVVGKAAAGMLIPGTSYSGDNLRMPIIGGRGMIGVNSGELILNESSQDNLAASIRAAESLVGMIGAESSYLSRSDQGLLADSIPQGTGGGTSSHPYVSGENIYLGVSNHLKRSGQGEIVTTNMLRRMGLM